jgi:hypothetical protein
MRSVNGCGVELTDKLEKLQLEVARIATGLPAYASRDSLYLETARNGKMFTVS